MNTLENLLSWKPIVTKTRCLSYSIRKGLHEFMTILFLCLAWAIKYIIFFWCRRCK